MMLALGAIHLASAAPKKAKTPAAEQKTKSAPAAAALKIVEASEPKVNCVYQSNCALIITDSMGEIPMTTGFSQAGILQSRTFDGILGAPAVGKIGYQYRVAMTQAAGGDVPCVKSVRIDFGPVLKFRYSPDSEPGDVYVVASGNVGKIGLVSASQDKGHITFVFSRPVCVGETIDRSDSSYFFGLTAAGMPMPSTAQLELTGGTMLNLPVRVPRH
jgi:hypothetical protein